MAEQVRDCMRCGRRGARMTPVLNHWVKRIDGYRCRNVAACNGRVSQLGLWVGVRVLRRRDLDGTRWTIHPHPPATPLHPAGFSLTCEYRRHRVQSWHASVDEAKAHADDYTASMVSRSLREYASGGPR